MSYVKKKSTRKKDEKKSSTPVSSRWSTRFSRHVNQVAQLSEVEQTRLREKYPDRSDLSESFLGYWLWVLFKTIAILVFLYVLIVFVVFI